MVWQNRTFLSIHLIPRRKGDTANPKGGVRGVIQNKHLYSLLFT
jgi:diadenosine tetraphosphate (Ap4A) HIT family hydrolase|tara:strand:+ start:150 stop:281 length:132 start_codon:yes stop_codon:yes gene_type:complete